MHWFFVDYWPVWFYGGMALYVWYLSIDCRSEAQKILDSYRLGARPYHPKLTRADRQLVRQFHRERYFAMRCPSQPPSLLWKIRYARDARAWRNSFLRSICRRP